LFGGEFNKKYGCDPRPNARCRLRLLDSIEKMRKLLTGNKEADIHCDSLMEDEDFHKHFKRSDLEELIAPFLERFKNCVTEAFEKSGLKNKKLDFVELVGDATRMTSIQDILKGIFPEGMEMSRTLNSQETVARGCALQAAMLSPNFMVQNFEVTEFNQHPIQIQYKFNNDGASLKENDIFGIGTSYPSTKTITFANKLGGLDLLVKYNEAAELLPGLPKQIA
jgi:heat shock protein 4